MHVLRDMSCRDLAAITLLAIGCSADRPAADAAIEPDAADDCALLAARADALLDDELEGSPFTGMVFGLSTPRCGATMATSGLVLRDPETAMEADRIMTVSSVAKTFLAVVVLQLVEEGELTLSDPVATWMPELPSADAMTLRHLLGHRSGLRDHWVLPCYPDTPTPQEIIACIADLGLRFSPGDGYYYSNTGYTVLGLVVEAVAGQPLHAAIRSRVLEPLGLADTMFLGDPVPAGREMHTYAGDVDVTGQEDPYRTWACADLLSDPDDLLRFFRELFTGDLVAASSLAAMTTFLPTNGFPPGTYGLGLVGDQYLDDDEQLLYRLWGNGGRGDAMNDSFYIPELDAVATLFVNERYSASNIWLPDEILERLIRELGPTISGQNL
jgi:D-alanyl-D-alanine carboxypeptidase